MTQRRSCWQWTDRHAMWSTQVRVFSFQVVMANNLAVGILLGPQGSLTLELAQIT